MSKLPEYIGKYRVVAVIGRGGMGSVYKAHDPHLDRMVAVKVMNDDAEVGSEARARFLREAQSAARLNHSNIITVYELGEERGRIFIVMEFLEGEQLSRLIDRVPPLPLPEKLALMLQICDGLGFAHQRGVVHRDVKPANVIVLESGQVKILDFGIARLTTSDLTRSGLLMGTPNYMSPEQARGRRTDARTDVFSAGVVFYELLSGRRPFAGGDYFETLEKLRSVDPTWLGELVPGLPDGLCRAIHKALAKDVGQRHGAIDELRRELASVLGEIGGGAAELREAVSRRLGEVVRLHRKLVAAVGAAALDEEKLPVAELTGSDIGLRTLLGKLESQAQRLQSLARDVERLEPVVERGIAAAERGDYEVAARELDRVLAEIPLHQRARDYRDRVRHEEELERTVRAFQAPLPASPEPPPPAPVPPVAVPPVAAAVPVGAAPVVSPADAGERSADAGSRTRPPAPLPRVVGTGLRGDETIDAAGHRGRWTVAVVGVLAVVGGGAVLFGPLGSPRARPGATPPAASSVAAGTGGSAPVTAPAAEPPGAPSAPSPAPRPAPAAASPETPRAEPGAQPPRPAPSASVPVPAPPRPATPARPAPEVRPPVRPPGPGPERREAVGPIAPRPGPVEGGRVPGTVPEPRKVAPRRPELTPEQEKVVEDRLTLAQLFETRGDNVRALREYRRVLEIDPTHPEARRGLLAVEQAIKAEPARTGQ